MDLLSSTKSKSTCSTKGRNPNKNISAVGVKNKDNSENMEPCDLDTDISQLEPPTFTTLHNKEQEAIMSLNWDHKVNLIGKKVPSPMVHCCEICVRPILIYGRLIPCKHVFCLSCAKDGHKTCPRCKEKVARVEQTNWGSVFMCLFGGSRYGSDGCRRTYLSQRDLQAHFDHRHSDKPKESLNIKNGSRKIDKPTSIDVTTATPELKPSQKSLNTSIAERDPRCSDNRPVSSFSAKMSSNSPQRGDKHVQNQSVRATIAMHSSSSQFIKQSPQRHGHQTPQSSCTTPTKQSPVLQQTLKIKQSPQQYGHQTAQNTVKQSTQNINSVISPSQFGQQNQSPVVMKESPQHYGPLNSPSQMHSQQFIQKQFPQPHSSAFMNQQLNQPSFNNSVGNLQQIQGNIMQSQGNFDHQNPFSNQSYPVVNLKNFTHSAHNQIPFSMAASMVPPPISPVPMVPPPVLEPSSRQQFYPNHNSGSGFNPRTSSPFLPTHQPPPMVPHPTQSQLTLPPVPTMVPPPSIVPHPTQVPPPLAPQFSSHPQWNQHPNMNSHRSFY